MTKIDRIEMKSNGLPLSFQNPRHQITDPDRAVDAIRQSFRLRIEPDQRKAPAPRRQRRARCGKTFLETKGDCLGARSAACGTQAGGLADLVGLEEAYHPGLGIGRIQIGRNLLDMDGVYVTRAPGKVDAIFPQQSSISAADIM